MECVFDGAARQPDMMGSPTSVNGVSDPVVSRSVSKYGVRLVYTGARLEADTYIESRCLQAKNDVTQGKLTGSLIVATDDAMIRLAGQNAGAYCMSADRFVTELKAVRKGVSYRVESTVASLNGQAMRPEKLWGTDVVSPRLQQNRGLVKDVAAEKQRRKEQRELEKRELEKLGETVDIPAEETGVPWWAQMPNRSSWS